MPRRNNLLTHGSSLLWLYLVYRCAAGWIEGRPEWSLLGTWENGAAQIECRSDGSVRSGSTSQLIAWKGSRFIFSNAELASAARQYTPNQAPWDLLLAQQCGVLRRSDKDFLDGPHVNHKAVGETIEATVKWIDKNQFSLGEIRYTKAKDP